MGDMNVCYVREKILRALYNKLSRVKMDMDAVRMAR